MTQDLKVNLEHHLFGTQMLEVLSFHFLFSICMKKKSWDVIDLNLNNLKGLRKNQNKMKTSFEEI